ncbi:hypothetical protein LCM4573_08445 [Rhizobium sp. LCM 4573]|nr:autotransporter outer membrane beta-barrel domain-containing protein [Rhizobium sp. LCM 4573]OHV77302.1 hypothetical protein LCM4573_08445 [Rhizobium sp. LCM 4573]
MSDGTVTTASGTGILSQSELGSAGITMAGGAVTVQSGTNPVLSAVVNNAVATSTASISMSGGTVTNNGSGDGLFARNNGAGTYNINVASGTVTGGGGNGAAIHTAGAGNGTVTIDAGVIIDGSASGVALRDGDADRDGSDENNGSATITTAGTLTGDVVLGGGTDTLTVTGGDISGNITGDGTDLLTFDLGSGSFVYSAPFSITGIDALTVNSGSLQLDGSSTSASIEVASGKLAVNGTAIAGGGIDVLADGRLQGTGTVVGSLTSAGTIAPGNSIGTLTIDGDYVGSGGTLEVETVLGDDVSSTDLLVISGGTSGSTNVQVVNLGGAGAQTVEGIKIVDVGGASNGAFALQGDYVYQGDQAVVAGAYAYRLYKNGVSDPADGDWYLRSALISPDEPAPGPGPGPGPHEPAPTPLYQAGVPIYEAYAGALQTFNQLGTLQQRLGNRHWTVVAQGADGISNEMTVSPGIGMWGEIEGARAEFNPESTTGAQYDTTIWRLKAGFDTSLYEGAAGNFIGGVAVHYGTVSADVSSIYGSGSIDTKGYGLSGMLTWYGNDGWYVDSQAQATWYDSDLFSETAGIGLTEGNNGFGYALGIEVGKRIPIDPEWAFTPQAQLAWSSVDFDDFADPFGAGVALGSGDSLIGRLGLAIDRQTEWRDAAGNISRAHIYGIANLYYDFKDGSTVDVAGTPIRSENDGLWGGLGMGGTVDWAEGKYSLYGEVMARTGLKDFGDSHAFTGTVGFRMKW